MTAESLGTNWRGGGLEGAGPAAPGGARTSVQAARWPPAAGNAKQATQLHPIHYECRTAHSSWITTETPQHKTCYSRSIDHKKRPKCRIWLTPGAGVNLRLGKIIGVGKAQIVGEARKARRRNDLQNVICQLLPAPSNLPLWLCLASYVEKILIRAFAFRQAFIICSAFEDFISYVCQLCNRCICSLLRPNKYKL